MALSLADCREETAILRNAWEPGLQAACTRLRKCWPLFWFELLGAFAAPSGEFCNPAKAILQIEES
jgi:hypothetical protein